MKTLDRRRTVRRRASSTIARANDAHDAVHSRRRRLRAIDARAVDVAKARERRLRGARIARTRHGARVWRVVATRRARRARDDDDDDGDRAVVVCGVGVGVRGG
jgi:hypothetical protein